MSTIKLDLIKVEDSFYHLKGKIGQDMEICSSTLGRYFDLLPDHQPITIVISSTPSDHAYKCKLKNGNVQVTKSDGHIDEHWLMDYTTDWLLANYPILGKKPFYVSILQ